MWQAAAALDQGAAAPIAVPTAAVAVLVPSAADYPADVGVRASRTRQRAPAFAPIMKTLVILRPWSMVEVCMLGILVAVIKLSSLVQVYLGAGVWAMAALMVLMTIIAGRDVRQLWAETTPAAATRPCPHEEAACAGARTRRSGLPRLRSGVRRCGHKRGAGHLSALRQPPAPAPSRQPRKSTADLIAALILYIPVNLYPVMYTTFLGSGFASTIMAGIIDFWNSGSYGIALVIFIASIAVPCVKFAIMGLLLVTCRRKSKWARKERTKLYRVVEMVGYWSFLDVLVVAIVASLVEFHALSETQPRVGILFFGAVVILTMLSAMSFDARLIWDDEKNERH